jgi:hypothetical protein
MPEKALMPSEGGVEARHVMDNNTGQSKKASSPMFVTLAGMVRDDRAILYPNASYSILVTLPGMKYTAFDFPAGYTTSTVVSALNNTPFTEE